MKLLQITALVLCLNMPLMYGNDDDDVQLCKTMFKVSSYGTCSLGAAAGLFMTMRGIREIASAIAMPENIHLLPINTQPDNRSTRLEIKGGLEKIKTGTMCTTGCLVAMVLLQAIGEDCESIYGHDSSGY